MPSIGRAIIPLDGLVGQFPTTADQFTLAYGESVAAVDFMIRTYGKPALVKLIRSYAGGRERRRGVQGRAGRRHGRLQRRLAEEPGRADAEGLRAAARPAGPVPPGWDGSAAGGVDGARRLGAGLRLAPAAHGGTTPAAGRGQ